MKKEENLTKLQKGFLKILDESGLNISMTCEQIGIDRGTYYNWMKKDAFAEAVDCQKEATIDYAESKLMMAIKSGNLTAVIFFLKTKGKKRGYIETQEIEHQGALPSLVELVKKYQEEKRQKEKSEKKRYQFTK